MNFLNIGPMELVLVLVVALVVFGPAKLPGIARDLGKTVREFQAASRELTTRVVNELESDAAQSNVDQGRGDALTGGDAA